ncbi:MAG: Gfo/Idh/MocA family oxidoreductase [Candidatus Hydrogenedentes bacterium]|nr:Gfo/Idh/MocA family oxidoreductase [Candidatus Hydrogenedentota bacterium]
MSLVPDPNNIRLAMLGMVEGNGHPFSWSAIVNGRYDAEAMAECGYPVIPQYLGAQPKEALGIPGVQVTHVWCDDPDDAPRVGRASCIPFILERPEDAIGVVDAVVVATDIGHEHVDRCRPFIEAGIPIFIDKPMTDNTPDLRQFIAWRDAGCPFMSTSAMRYGREFRALDSRLGEVGDCRLITVSMAKSWERYGIHALEAVYPMLPAGGYRSVSHQGDENANFMLIEHESGVKVLLNVISDLYGAFGHVQVLGTKGALSTKFEDTFHAFKTQLEAFVHYLRTGASPVPFEQTVEQMKIIIAGIESRERGGETVRLDQAP